MNTRIAYTANGEIQQFHFAFNVWRAGDVRVHKNGLSVPASEYEIMLPELPENPTFGHSGGSVTFIEAPAKGDTITIFRELSASRIVSYQPAAAIDPSVLNMDLNYMMEALRDIADKIS
ncbi:MAG: hypothetical protein FWE64_01400 [Alphaproteobacteria bacterium]|nr:hypothetical protein [Alphaproteobacteria bacterium]